MAYEKQTWTTGEVITQEKLNHMEDGIAENDKGYSCYEEMTTLFDGEVSFYWTGSYGTGNVSISAISTVPNSDTITVTLDEETIELPKYYDSNRYGDFSQGGKPVQYPVNLSFSPGNCSIYTNVRDQHAIVIQAPLPKTETTECFEKAVTKVIESIPSGTKNFIDGTGQDSVVQKSAKTASGQASLAIGNQTEATDWGAFAKGFMAKATGIASSAEGTLTTASGRDSHAEGNYSKATSNGSHAEGYYTESTSSYTHAEGSYSKATAMHSHAEGSYTEATGDSAHAEGYYTKANANFSHTSGENTIANARAETVIGRYSTPHPSSSTSSNKSSYSTRAFTIGNGTDDDHRSNALVVRWDGTFVFADGTEITPAQFASLKALLNQ